MGAFRRAASGVAALLVALISPAAHAIEDLDPILEAARAAHAMPALAALVFKDGAIVAEGAVGERAAGSGVAVTRNDLWHIGSNTKAMTAMLAARLVDKGILRWDMTIGEVLGARLANMNPAFRDVTFADLLQHRSGLAANLPGLALILFRGDGRNLKEQRAAYVEAALSVPPAGERGKNFLYSNSGYVVAGAMVEAVTGRDYESLMAEEVFAPLGMTGVGYGPPGHDGALDQPIAHAGSEPVRAFSSADNPAVLASAGTVHLSLAAWARFAGANLDGMRGSTEFLSSESWKFLHTPPDIEGADYAGGWEVATEVGAGVIGHEGSNSLWYAVILISPKTNTAILLTANSGEARPALFEALTAILMAYPLAMPGQP